MSKLIENLILKILREDVTEVDGTTELSAAGEGTPVSKSGYNVYLLGGKTFGKGKLRTQHAQKLATQNGAEDAFVITFTKPSFGAKTNDNYILDDIKLMFSRQKRVGGGAMGFYNDGKHTYVVVPVKNTPLKKIFHIWIIDTSEYVDVIKQIQNKITTILPVTATTETLIQELLKLDKIPLMSKSTFKIWIADLEKLAVETKTDISALEFPNFSNITDLDVKISSVSSFRPNWDIIKDLGDGKTIINVPMGVKGPILGAVGEILHISKPGANPGEIINTYIPYNGILKFKDETSDEFIELTGKFKDGLPYIASSIVYYGLQQPTEIASFDGDITKENVVVIGSGTRAADESYAKLKVFIKEGDAVFNNGKTYSGTWYTDDTSISIQKQSSKFKTGYISTKEGKELGKYVDGKFSKTTEADKDTRTNLVAVDTVTYPFEWQTTSGTITVNDSGADYVYYFDNESWFEYPKTKFETEIKTIDTDLTFKKILQTDRINELNLKHGKTVAPIEKKEEPKPTPEPKPKSKKKYFTITSNVVNLYRWDDNNKYFILKLESVDKNNLPAKEWRVTKTKTGKIQDKSNEYTMYSIGKVKLKEGFVELWVPSARINIKEK